MSDFINPQDQDEDVSVESDPVTRVFAIPELRGKIISHCYYAYGFSPEEAAELFKLRLVSRSFNEAVLTCKEGAAPPLNVARIGLTDHQAPNGVFIPRRLQEEELNLLDPRLCRVIKAMGGPLPRQPQVDSAGRNQSLLINVQNLMDICVAHGEWILDLSLETPSSHLLQVMETIDNHCPNVQRLEVEVGLLSSPMTTTPHDDDKEISFQTKPALTKLSLIFPTGGDNQDGAVDSNSHTRRVTVALLKSVPNLRTFVMDSPAFMMLDLSTCQAIQDLTLRFNTALLDHQLRSLSEPISACCDTLQTLDLKYEKDEYEEDAGYVPCLLPASIPNLRSLSLDTYGNAAPFDPFGIPLLTMFLEGRAPLLRGLRFAVRDDYSNAADILKLWSSYVESDPAVNTLETFDLYDYTDIMELPPTLQYLQGVFPNLQQLKVRCFMLSIPRGDLTSLDPYMATSFRELRRWEQLKDVTLMITSGSISIFQLHQLLGMLGEGFFRSWELKSFSFGLVTKFRHGTQMLAGLEGRFGNEQLEELKNRLVWMNHMKDIDFRNIVMPPSGDIMDRLASFINENHLPIKFHESRNNGPIDDEEDHEDDDDDDGPTDDEMIQMN